MSKYRITKHGFTYIDKKKPMFCPECKSELSDDNYYVKRVDKAFFKFFTRERTYKVLKCETCGCEMEKLDRRLLISHQSFSYLVISIICALVAIAFAAFFIFGVKVDPECKSWIGPAAVVSFFCFFIFYISYDILYS